MDGWAGIHGVPDQNAFGQLLLLEELLDVLGHDGVVMVRGVEGVAMVTEVL
jgi:hypothetical protein